MNPIPNKGFFDIEPQEELVAKALDSVKHLEERAASIKAEDDLNRQEQAAADKKQEADQVSRDQLARDQEIQQLEYRAGLVRDGETREMLLDRIRKMREIKVEEPRYIGRSAEMEEQYKREQEAGRAAVAAAQAQEDKMRELRAKAEEDDDHKQLGTVERVYQANPSQDEVFPTIKATLPGSSSTRKK